MRCQHGYDTYCYKCEQEIKRYHDMVLCQHGNAGDCPKCNMNAKKVVRENDRLWSTLRKEERQFRGKS